MQNCKALLLERGVNPLSSIEYDINGEVHTITLEWIIESYLSTEKSELFVELFEKALKTDNASLEQFFEKMGQLILMSSLSKESIVC